jgi:hypothetical protein
VFEVQRDYLYFANDETRSGVNVNVNRDFSASMRLDVDLSTENVERASRGEDLDDSQHRLNRLTVELTRELGSRSELSSVAGFNQKTEAGDQNYDGWWIGVRYRYEF